MNAVSVDARPTHHLLSHRRVRHGRLRALSLTAVMAAAALMTSCGFVNTSSSDTETTSLSLAVNAEQHAALAGLLPAFTEESGIQVNETHAATADLNERLRIQLSSKTAPDVFRVSPGSSSAVAANVLGKTGNLATLTGDWTSRLPAATAGLATVDNEVKAYPLSQNLLVMADNKKVFDKLGLTVPTTWTEFLDVCEKLKAAEITPISAGFTGGIFLQFPVYQLAATLVYADPEIDKKMQSGDVTFSNSPEWKSVFTKLQDLQKRGYLTSGANGVSSDQATDTVVSGKAGMISTVSSLVPDGDIGVFALPATDDPTQTRVPAAPDFIGINADAKNPEASKKLIEFLAQPKNVKAYATAAKSLPALSGTDATISETLAPIAPYLEDGRTAPYANYLWPNGDTQQRLLQSGQQLIAGEISVDALLQQLSAEYAKGGK